MEVEADKTYCLLIFHSKLYERKRPFLVASINHQISAYMLLCGFCSQNQLLVAVHKLHLKQMYENRRTWWHI